ncbi:MAG: nucleoside kinase [Anaerovoracaceae bacterium]
MKINLKLGPREEDILIEAKEDVTIEELCEIYGKDLPYTILAAKADGKIVELTNMTTGLSSIELLDMRNHGANLIYQYSLSLIYLKAIEDVLGKVPVEIQNSLNKGLYTQIKTKLPITQNQVKAIELRMEKLVKADKPIVKHILPRKEALKFLADEGYTEKFQLMQSLKGLTSAKFYSIDNCWNFFYGHMVPSTGYIKHFQLKKYRRGVILRFPYPSNPNEIPPYVDEKKLCLAFGEAKKWNKLTGVSYLPDLNRKVENGEYKDLILLSEALHEKKISEIADMITGEKKRIILIAGPSSSGKTTFARRLCIQLRVNGLEPLYLGTDDYFTERYLAPLDEEGNPNFENLDVLDIELFNDHLNKLMAGEVVDLPAFDFIEGKKNFGKRITSIKAHQPIVIEGIHGLNQALTPYVKDENKFKIYISPFTQLNVDSHNRIPTTDARMLRRMVRDYLYRGHSGRSTIAEWPKVRAGEDKNIFPFSGEADVLFNSALTYELAVLKKYAKPLLEAIEQDQPEHSEAVRMLKFIDAFDVIEDDSIIPNNSIIREFIGGSIFVE